MVTLKKEGGNTNAATGRTASVSASCVAQSAVAQSAATLRANRAAKVASALKQANRKTGLFTKK